jgi:hypothetical protein
MSGLELIIPAIASGISSAGTAAASAVGTIGSALASPVVQGLGTLATVGGTVASGVAANKAAKAETRQLNAAATDEKAASQREADLERRRTKMILSDQQAKGASSGAGTGGTLLDIMASTAAEGDIKDQQINYLGASRAAGLKDKAAATKYRASADYAGTMLDAASQGIEGAYKIKNRRFG